MALNDPRSTPAYDGHPTMNLTSTQKGIFVTLVPAAPELPGDGAASSSAAASTRGGCQLECEEGRLDPRRLEESQLPGAGAVPAAQQPGGRGAADLARHGVLATVLDHPYRVAVHGRDARLRALVVDRHLHRARRSQEVVREQREGVHADHVRDRRRRGRGGGTRPRSWYRVHCSCSVVSLRSCSGNPAPRSIRRVRARRGPMQTPRHPRANPTRAWTRPRAPRAGPTPGGEPRRERTRQATVAAARPLAVVACSVSR